MHPTQLYEAICYFAIFGLLWWIYRTGCKANNAGYIVGLAVTLIFVCRFFIEFIKNTQVDFESTMALNMGQLLSLPFIAGGVIMMVWSLRAKKV